MPKKSAKRRKPQPDAMPTANEGHGASEGFLAGAPDRDFFDAMVLLMDNKSPDPLTEAWEIRQANALLDAAGAAEADTLALRILAVAEKWLARVAHVDSCACMQCAAARAIVSEAIVLKLKD